MKVSSKNSGPLMLLEAIFWHLNFFLLSVAMDAWKGWKWIETLNAMPTTIAKKYHGYCFVMKFVKLYKSIWCVVKGTTSVGTLIQN